MGTKQFSSALCTQHLESYNILQLQYLYLLISMQSSLHTWLQASSSCHAAPKAFPGFSDKSDDGFHGFIPSSSWL
jgi:hypothetical protein